MQSRRLGTRTYEEISGMKQLIRRLWTDESGQDMVEYALLLVLITLVVIVAMRIMGPVIANFFNDVSDNLNTI